MLFNKRFDHHPKLTDGKNGRKGTLIQLPFRQNRGRDQAQDLVVHSIEEDRQRQKQQHDSITPRPARRDFDATATHAQLPAAGRRIIDTTKVTMVIGTTNDSITDEKACS